MYQVGFKCASHRACSHGAHYLYTKPRPCSIFTFLANIYLALQIHVKQASPYAGISLDLPRMNYVLMLLSFSRNLCRPQRYQSMLQKFKLTHLPSPRLSLYLCETKAPPFSLSLHFPCPRFHSGTT